MPFTNVRTNDPVVAAASVNSLSELREKVERIKELRIQYGKVGPFSVVPTPFHYPGGLTRSEAQRFCEGVQALAEAGATGVHTSFPAPSRSAYLETIAWFGEEVVARFAPPRDTA
jgi:hypothetical protein